MGMLDAFLENPKMIGDVAKFAKDNPQVAKAAMGLLGSGGGNDGLGGVLGALQSKGFGELVSSWIGTGSNKAISPGAAAGGAGLAKAVAICGTGGREPQRGELYFGKLVAELGRQAESGRQAPGRRRDREHDRQADGRS